MRKNKCKESDYGTQHVDCNNKPEYCSEHYNKIQTKYYNTKKKLSNRNHTISLMIGVFILILSIILFLNIENIDENKFCLSKLNTYFPEYKFESATYNNAECKGTYTSNVVTRDGLSEVGKQEQKSFKLINKEDIKYLGKDDDYQIIALFLSATSITIFVFTLTSLENR